MITLTHKLTHQARCTVTGYVAGTYQSAERAQETCDYMNARLPLHRFVVVDKGAPDAHT